MNDEPKNSRNIPLPIQREVRQRCGFGCVICGLPLYEYEHMEEWAIVKRHVSDEITLLCDQHHREKTSGLLPKEEVIQANKNPFNLRKGVSKPYTLYYKGNNPKARIGALSIETNDAGYGTQFIPLLIDKIPIIGFVLTDGHFLLNLIIFDEYNHIVLRIINNQLIYKTSFYDVQLVGKKLTVRKEQNKILLELIFKTPNTIVINKGNLFANGVHIIIENNNIIINNSHLVFNNCIIKAPVGISIGEFMLPAGIGIEKIDRYTKS